jgi:hypothetical protein
MLGEGRTDSIRSYEYLLMATGLGSAVGFGTALVAVIFDSDLIVDDLGTAAVSLVLAFTAAGLLWWLLWSRSQEAPRAEEAPTLPRRFYLLGMAILLGLTAVGAVVGILFFVFQLLFDLGPDPSTLIIEIALAGLAGGATYHLFSEYRRDAALREEAKGTPYLLTVICSHPGPLASLLPAEATLRVLHRGDGVGAVDDLIGAEIVEATRGRDSIVWVGAEGFEVAPAMKT